MKSTYLPPLRLLWILALATVVNMLYGQKEYNHWFLGYTHRLNFNTIPPEVLSSSSNFGYTSNISDSAGNLLFVTDGQTVWNRQGDIMLNGTELAGREDRSFCVYIFKIPENLDMYGILMTVRSNNARISYIYHAVVDMSQDFGKGAVIRKNERIINIESWDFSITRHGNGQDFWIAARQQYSERIFTLPYTKMGIDTMAIQWNNVDLVGRGGAYHSMKFNKDGYCLGLLSSDSLIFLNHFDVYTGKVSTPLYLKMKRNSAGLYDYEQLLGFEFSPGSKYLYTIEQYRNIGPWIGYYKSTELVQYDLRQWDADAIEQSRVVLDSGWLAPGLYTAYVDIQLGPDDKIYVLHGFMGHSAKDSALDVIHQPDQKGLDCDLALRSLQLQDSKFFSQLPRMIYTPKFRGLGPDKVLCQGDSLQLNVVAQTGVYVWNTGQQGKTLWVHNSGKYSVTAYIGIDTFYDTIDVNFQPFPVINLGKDSIYCSAVNDTLYAGEGVGYTYLWSTGDTSESIAINNPGTYYVKVINANGCNAYDTVTALAAPPPVVYIGNDSTFCGQVDYTLKPQSTGLYHFWNTGDTTRMLYINNDGTYSLLVKSEENCQDADTIQIDKLNYPFEPGLTDTIVCADVLRLDAGNPGMNYLWNTGEQSRMIEVTSSGIYEVEVSHAHCKIISRLQVSFLPWDSCNHFIYIPNSFSPNGDGLNDVFTITANKVKHTGFQIYDRWGACIYTGNAWDGSYKGTEVPIGVYFYTLSYSYYHNGVWKRKHESGNVHLVR